MNLFKPSQRWKSSIIWKIAAIIFTVSIYLNLNLITSLDVNERNEFDFDVLQKTRSKHFNVTTSLSNIEEKINNTTDVSESGIIQEVVNRATASLKTCKKTPHTNDFITKQKHSNASLPEFGAINALSGWLKRSDSFKKEHSMHSKSVNWVHNLTCSLPAEKSCDIEGFTVIFMSHTLERLRGLARGIKKVAGWKNTHEIILVWNSEPALIQQESDFAQLIQQYHEDPSHPLRIFYALENGLENNLFNRYHPLISPKMEAILYFDDDGPFFDEHAMVTGFELWKRDSGRQVGCFPRNIRFKSDRMIEQGITEIEKSINWVLEGGSKLSPEDQQTSDKRPEFIPTCQKAGDKLEYNYYIFAQYQAHILLPSGSFIHRNFLCWLWHPALEEVRQFVLDHPTHPDDMTVSTVISHLTGKAPRVFSRRLIKANNRKLMSKSLSFLFQDRVYSSLKTVNTIFDRKDENHLKVDKTTFNDSNMNVEQDRKSKEMLKIQSEKRNLFQRDSKKHRKLLWEKENWGELREEAITNIMGYFGSINPGSVGWCTGTPFQKQNSKKEYYCDPEFPTIDDLPWMVEGGLGNDVC